MERKFKVTMDSGAASQVMPGEHFPRSENSPEQDTKMIRGREHLRYMVESGNVAVLDEQNPQIRSRCNNDQAGREQRCKCNGHLRLLG